MADTPTSTAPIEVFFSYSHKDHKLRDKLQVALSNLKNQNLIAGWHDQAIAPGVEWAGEIDEHLNSARVILLLLSPDFLASKYCSAIEMTRAIERHHAGEARVVPIFLRPCDLAGTAIAGIQGLPTDALGLKEITRWGNRDSAWLNVAQGLRRVIEEINGGAPAPTTSPPPAPAPVGSRHVVAATTSVSTSGASDADTVNRVAPPPPPLPSRRPRWWWAVGGVGVLGLVAALIFYVTHGNGPVVLPDPPASGVSQIPDPPAHDMPRCARLGVEARSGGTKMNSSVSVINDSGKPLTVLRYAHTCTLDAPAGPGGKELNFQDKPFRLPLAAGERRDYPTMFPGYTFFRVVPEPEPKGGEPVNLFDNWYQLEPGVYYELHIIRFNVRPGREPDVMATLDKAKE